MILALGLLAVAQGATALSAPTFEALLQKANQAWYELPRATTTFRFLDVENKERAAFSESRDGERYFFRATQATEPVIEVRSNGTQVVVQNFQAREYSVESATPRAAWTPPKKGPEPDSEEATLSLMQNEGMVLRVSGGIFTFGPERAGELDGVPVRLIKGELVKTTADGESRLRFEGTLDRKAGFFRRAKFTIVRSQAPEEATTAIWTCEPTSPKVADYDLDPARVVGWTKLVGTGG